jgi:hypothetical protein
MMNHFQQMEILRMTLFPSLMMPLSVIIIMGVLAMATIMDVLVVAVEHMYRTKNIQVISKALPFCPPHHLHLFLEG